MGTITLEVGDRRAGNTVRLLSAKLFLLSDLNNPLPIMNKLGNNVYGHNCYPTVHQ